jgi:hypothetical protein
MTMLAFTRTLAEFDIEIGHSRQLFETAVQREGAEFQETVRPPPPPRRRCVHVACLQCHSPKALLAYTWGGTNFFFCPTCHLAWDDEPVLP